MTHPQWFPWRKKQRPIRNAFASGKDRKRVPSLRCEQLETRELLSADVTLSASTTLISEYSLPGSWVDVTATLNNPQTTTVVVPFSYSGTATFGADYYSGGSYTTIYPGFTSSTISIPIVPDGEFESDEILRVQLPLPQAALANVRG